MVQLKKLSKYPYFQSRFVCLLFFKSEFILRLLVQSFNISFRIYQSKLSELFICSLAASIYCEHHTVSLFLSVSPFPVYSYIKSGIFQQKCFGLLHFYNGEKSEDKFVGRKLPKKQPKKRNIEEWWFVEQRSLLSTVDSGSNRVNSLIN